jgi:hypothetical protein
LANHGIAKIHINSVLAASSSPNKNAAVRESIMAQTTIAYLEQRYAALKKEIENALQHGLTDHQAIADLICRKLIVAEEIKHNRHLLELIRGTQN